MFRYILNISQITLFIYSNSCASRELPIEASSMNLFLLLFLGNIIHGEISEIMVQYSTVTFEFPLALMRQFFFFGGFWTVVSPVSSILNISWGSKFWAFKNSLWIRKKKPLVYKLFALLQQILNQGRVEKPSNLSCPCWKRYRNHCYQLVQESSWRDMCVKPKIHVSENCLCSTNSRSVSVISLGYDLRFYSFWVHHLTNTKCFSTISQPSKLTHGFLAPRLPISISFVCLLRQNNKR